MCAICSSRSPRLPTLADAPCIDVEDFLPSSIPDSRVNLRRLLGKHPRLSNAFGSFSRKRHGLRRTCARKPENACPRHPFNPRARAPAVQASHGERDPDGEFLDDEQKKSGRHHASEGDAASVTLHTSVVHASRMCGCVLSMRNHAQRDLSCLACWLGRHRIAPCDQTVGQLSKYLQKPSRCIYVSGVQGCEATSARCAPTDHAGREPHLGDTNTCGITLRRPVSAGKAARPSGICNMGED